MQTIQLNEEEKKDVLRLLKLRDEYQRTHQIEKYFATKSDRAGYFKHMEFFRNGANHRQRAFLAANRVGKSVAGAYETTLHLTGDYPVFWEGRRFDKPTKGWCVGKTSETVRDTIQIALLGPVGEWGTGLIPADRIEHIAKSAGNRADTITIRHKAGGVSTLGFKSSDQGRQSFEGATLDFIWADEEVDLGVWTECLMRTTTTDGIIYTTFTPLKGLSDMVLSLVKDGNPDTPQEGIAITQCSWNDCPHLSETVKQEMLNALPPFQRLARSQGIPQLGSGVIIPVDPAEYTVKPFELPKHWRRIGGLDIGWRVTGALWAAINDEDGCIYVYSEHYRGEAEPSVHAASMRARGNIPLCIDTAAHGRSQIDGRNLYQMYEELGLPLINAQKSVETGLFVMWELFSGGKLKIFNTCPNILSELKTYRRDDKGNVVKSNDHLCDALRYLLMGRDNAKLMVPKDDDLAKELMEDTSFYTKDSWMFS